jgi:hypothetical protein
LQQLHVGFYAKMACPTEATNELFRLGERGVLLLRYKEGVQNGMRQNHKEGVKDGTKGES